MENNEMITAPQKEASEMIDLREVFKTLLKKKMFFLKLWIVTFILACAYILPQPRVFNSSIVLSPEAGGQSISGGIAGLASSFGIDIGGNNAVDAIYPELYPDLMQTNKFLVDMLYVNVSTVDGEVNTTYMDYLRKYSKDNPYFYPLNWTMTKLKKLTEKPQKSVVAADGRLDPTRLSKNDDKLVDAARSCINCDVDVKTSVITITAYAQDPQVSTQLAVEASKKLQAYITDYRTRKARFDAEYYKDVLDSVRIEYKAAVKAYSDYCDHNQDVLLQSHISKRDELENEMQACLTTYNGILAQLNMAKAKVQERTPAFTVIEDASMPVKPQKPKRMVFVAIMLFLATIGGSIYIFKDELLA